MFLALALIVSCLNRLLPRYRATADPLSIYLSDRDRDRAEQLSRMKKTDARHGEPKIDALPGSLNGVKSDESVVVSQVRSNDNERLAKIPAGC